MVVGDRIRELRTAHGLSRRELSDRTGVEQNTIYRIESGRNKPSSESLERLARGLGVPVPLLFSDDPIEFEVTIRSRVGEPEAEEFPQKESRRPDQPPLVTIIPGDEGTVVDTRIRHGWAHRLLDFDEDAVRFIKEKLGRDVAILNLSPKELEQEIIDADVAKIANMLEIAAREYRHLRSHYASQRETEHRRQLNHVYGAHVAALQDALAEAVRSEIREGASQ